MQLNMPRPFLRVPTGNGSCPRAPECSWSTRFPRQWPDNPEELLKFAHSALLTLRIHAAALELSTPLGAHSTSGTQQVHKAASWQPG